MKPTMLTRFVLLFLAALLVSPMIPSDSPVEAKKRPRTVTRTFSNPDLITMTFGAPPPISARLYPSAIEVGGLRSGKIRDVNVRLRGFEYNDPDDVEVLLVGPDGQTAVVMANVGGIEEVEDVTLTLDDEAAAHLPDSAELQSGTFRPTNAAGGAIAFNTPAPSASANAALSVFDGSNPNGTWRLFVQNDTTANNLGEFTGGWELEITATSKSKKKKR